jgi:hypothetical protein
LVPHEAGPWSTHARFASVITPAAPRGSGVSAATAMQRPSALGMAQNTHWPSHALSQQTPSAQKPDLHWLFWSHA